MSYIEPAFLRFIVVRIFFGMLTALSALGYSLSGAVIVSDDFSYPDGPLSGQSPSPGFTWTTISGTANEIQVSGGSISLSDSLSEDVQIPFSAVSSGSIYFGFDVQVADPGAYTGTDFEYFAHFDAGSFTARLDVAAFSAAGWKPGIATTSSTAESIWTADLDYATPYRIIVGYDFTTGLASTWIDASSVTDTRITSTTAGSGSSIDGFNFRQSSSSPDLDLVIDNLTVATDFASVAVPEPSTYAMLFGLITMISVAIRRNCRRLSQRILQF
jgi:hypothetical protein